MWVFSRFGFCSAVQDFTSSDVVHVRGRVAGDLERMLSAAGINAAVLTTLDADYRYRAALSRADFVVLLLVIGNSVDYPSFKSAVARDPEQHARLAAYHQVWHALRGIQE